MDVSNPFVLGALGALVALAVVKIIQLIWAKYFFDERNATVAEHIRSVQQKIKDDKRKASYSLPIPKGWYKVCRSDEIKPGQVKEYTICENILAVYRSEDGKTVGVLDADCPHLGANMAIEGRVVGDCLQCPFHLIEFGADGSCTKVPWTKSVPPQLKAKSWHVQEYLGFVMVWYDSEKNPPSFELPESIAEQVNEMYFVTYKGPYSVKMHIQEFAENSADFQHFGAIHNQMQIPFTTKRLPFVTLKHNVDWKMGQGSNSHLLNFYDTAWIKLFGKEYPSTKASATITMIGPAALAVFEFDVPKVGHAIVVMTHTPIDPLCMNVEFYAYAEKKMSRLMAWYLLGNWIAQWKNDISIWENKLYLHKPNVLQGDGPVKKLRRWFLQFYPKNYAATSINYGGDVTVLLTNMLEPLINRPIILTNGLLDRRAKHNIGHSKMMSIFQKIKALQNSYNKWFINNSDVLSKLENGLKTTLFLFPGRFKDSEVQAETMYSSIGLISLYHDYVFRKHVQTIQEEKSSTNTDLIKLIPDAKLRKKLKESNYFPRKANRLALLESIIENFELLIELVAVYSQGSYLVDRQPHKNPLMHFGMKNLHYLAIFFVEVLKAILRLIMLYKNNGSILAFHKIPPRAPLRPEEEAIEEELRQIGEANPKRRKTLLMVKEQLEAKRAKELKRIQDETPTKSTSSMILGEILWILRPVVYLVAVVLFGRHSWKPWWISLLIDIYSRRKSRSGKTLNDPESAELSRRTFNWLYYLLRSPFFEKFLAKKSSSTSIFSKFASLPVINVVYMAIIEFLQVYRQRYFYTAGSS